MYSHVHHILYRKKKCYDDQLLAKMWGAYAVLSARFSQSHASKKSRLHQICDQQILIYQQM